MEAPLMQVSWSRGREVAPAAAPARLADWLAGFWRLDSAQPFTAAETRLWLYWLHRFEVAGWPASLPGREALVAAQLGQTVAGLRRACAGLVGRALLRFEPAGAGGQPRWALRPAPAGLTASTTPLIS